jgi:hypothetical protein
MSIVNAILEKTKDGLTAALITNIDGGDPTRAGVVMVGPLQGDPDPDQARISITVHENDPDRFHGRAGASAIGEEWEDEVYEVECGGALTWRRRFTIKGRCLFVTTQEDKDTARSISAIVRARIESTLLNMDWTGVASGNEFVSRGTFAETLKGEMVQGGGPPDAYDFHIKVRFELLTTIGVIV